MKDKWNFWKVGKGGKVIKRSRNESKHKQGIEDKNR